jgi:hypothetical protein
VQRLACKEVLVLRFWKIFLLVAVLAGMTATAAFAGSPHFVTASATRSGDDLIVSFKEAGLGDEDQVDIFVRATAECINNGGHHPKAANKETVGENETVPVQNGKAEGTVTLTTSLSCSPPMEIRWTKVSVTDETNDVTKTIPGTF